ncbi:MAG: hypothetical protein QNJ38_10175 [Prochloraceae cyanobacterium]|nr:hypothetical protein [Prochloraceae cyanobacterium]
MTNDPNIPKESAIVETNAEEKAIVEQDNLEESGKVRKETMALIEAIRTKASSETQKAGEFTLEKYLETVRGLRAEIEKLEFKPEQVEESFKHIQDEAEKNWDSLTKKVQDFGDRLSETAKVAWETLTKPKESDKDEKK